MPSVPEDWEEAKSWIAEPLYGLTEYAPRATNTEGSAESKPRDPSISPLRTGITNPPSYLARITLVGAAGLAGLSREKSTWGVSVSYKGFNVRLRDWKRASWSIDPLDDTSVPEEILDELVKKVRDASMRMNEFMVHSLKKIADAGDFFLVNSYRHIRGALNHFMEQLVRSIESRAGWEILPIPVIDENPGEPVEVKDGLTITRMNGVSDHINKGLKLDAEISYNATASVGFLFSYIELLVDAWWAFDLHRPQSYFEFGEMTWDERFKQVLPISTDAQLKKIYDDGLRTWRKRVRDQMFHGLGGRPAILVPLPSIGLVPTDAEFLMDQPHFKFQPVSSNDAKEFLNLVEEFDSWTQANDEAWFVMRWVEYGFEIPCQPERVSEIRSWMTSRKEFEQRLAEHAEALDYLSEQY